MDGSHRFSPHPIALPAIFFDGACQGGLMGCGAWIKISGEECIHIRWHGGNGNNILAELMALWGGLYAGHCLGIVGANIFGDSRVIIEAVCGRSAPRLPAAQGWLLRTQRLWDRMNKPPIMHIFRELNTR